MKKGILLTLVLCSSFLGCLEVKADCSDSQNEAKNVNIKTENSIEKEFIPDVDNEGYQEEYDIIKIYTVISNITENLHVKVTNDYNHEELIINYKDTENGVVKLESPSIYMPVNYKVEVFTNDESCSTETVNEVEASTDTYNRYTTSGKCEENSDLEICKPFSGTVTGSYNEFVKLVDEERKRVDEKNKTFIDKVVESLSKYWLFILIPFLVIIIVFIVRIIILKRGKDNE